MSLSWDGTAYELENGDVLFVALSHGIDEVEMGVERSREAAVERARALLPAGYLEPEPLGGWLDLLVGGIFGSGRKFIARRSTIAVPSMDQSNV